jgi:hypothetical protein
MKAVQKEKKITIKFFLNRLLEPVTGEKGGEYFPLYIQVTYNRKNMQFKSKYGLYYQQLEEVAPALLSFEEQTLRKIIQYEAAQTVNDYELKGLKHKYEIYSTSITEALENYLKPRLRIAILKTNDELINVLNFNQPQATVARLYKAAQLLFTGWEKFLTVKLKEELPAYEQYSKRFVEPYPSYNFPTLIDWVNGSYAKELETALKAHYKNKPEIIKSVKALIEAAVNEKLKQLGA